MEAQTVKKDLGEMKPPKPQQGKFQTMAREISVKGFHWLLCQWNTCLNNNEDSFIWTTLNH
jgi:hypothetical protein